MNININHVIDRYKNIMSESDERYFNVTKYPIVNGYNWVCSGRSKGKTTSVLILALIIFRMYGKKCMYLRSAKTETVEAMINTLYTGLNTITKSDGRNLIQHITDDEYNKIYYLSRRKVFVIAREDSSDEDIKNAPVITYVKSLDLSSDMASGFADNECDIIIGDEMIDDRITTKSMLQLSHIVSTVFRERYNTFIFMLGNVSRGNPQLLIDMEIYKTVKVGNTPYFVHQTKLGTKVSCTLYNPPSEDDIIRDTMNKTYFGFDISGMETIRGVAVPVELFRRLPEDETQKINETAVAILALNELFEIYYVQSEVFQSMYYIKQGKKEFTKSTVFFSDDETLAYNEPFTYYNCGKEFPMMIDFIKHYRRNDVCFEDYICKVAVDSFMDLHNVPKNI